MSIDDRRFNKAAKVISDHSMKIIVVIVLFTLVMGYFASNIDMEADQEAFYPDTEKTRNLDDVENYFGATEGLVQVVYTSDEGNVLTKKVLNDMLDTKEGLKSNSLVNETLTSSEEVPDGATGLADLILKADRALKVEGTIIGLSNQTDDAVSIIQNQKEMYAKLNRSLNLGQKLLDFPDEQVERNIIVSYRGMSNILDEPKRWSVFEKYNQEFFQFIQVITDENITLDKKIAQTENLISKLNKQQPYGYSSFVDILKGLKSNLEISKNLPPAQGQKLSQASIGMTARFLTIPENLAKINPLNFSFDIPSLSMNETEEKERLNEMDDSEIKETVHEVINYDPKNLKRSVDETKSNFKNIQRSMGESQYILKDMIEDLKGITIKNQSLANSISRFQSSFEKNSTSLQVKSQQIKNEKTKLQSADQFGKQFQKLEKGITNMLSSDFDKKADESDLSAESSLLIVQMDTSLDKETRMDAQYELIDIAEENSEHSSVRVSASQVMMDQVNDSAANSLYFLLPLAFIYVIIVLMLVYRSIIESIVSLLSLVFAVIWTFGAGVLLGYQFNPMIIAVPILMTGLGIDYGIHLIMRFREERGKGRNIRKSIITSILTVGGALLLVTITTAVGFSSTTFSGIEVMKNFGVLATIGIFSSFLLFVVFLPAVVKKVEGWRSSNNDDSDKKRKSKRKSKKSKDKKENMIARFLSSSVKVSNNHPKLVLFVVLLLTVSSGYGAMQVDTTFDLQDFLPKDRSQYQNIEYLESNFNLNQTDAYIITNGDLADSEYLYALDETSENFNDAEMVLAEEGLSSPLTVMQTYGTAMPMSPDYNETIVNMFSNSDLDGDNIPDQNITELYDVLFEAPESRDSIENVLEKGPEKGYSSASAIIKVRENSEKINEDLDNAEELEEELKKSTGPLRDEGYNTEITSRSMIDQETVSDLSTTQIESLIASIIIVAFFLTIIFYYLHRSLALGIITTFPVSIVTLWLLGLVYFIGIPLNFMTITVTALTVGIGVAYSIHVTHKFVEDKRNRKDTGKAMKDTIQHTGGALLGALFTTVGALGILATSEILPISQFGYVTAIAISLSFLASVFVLPSALVLWARSDKRTKKRKKDLPTLKKR